MRTQRDPVLELRAAGRECLCSTAGESRTPSSCLRGAGASAPLGDLRMEPGRQGRHATPCVAPGRGDRCGQGTCGHVLQWPSARVWGPVPLAERRRWHGWQLALPGVSRS